MNTPIPGTVAYAMWESAEYLKGLLYLYKDEITADETAQEAKYAEVRKIRDCIERSFAYMNLFYPALASQAKNKSDELTRYMHLASVEDSRITFPPEMNDAIIEYQSGTFASSWEERFKRAYGKYQTVT